MGRNAKRMMKRMKRESDEFRVVVDQCLMILNQNGITVQFPWEVPEVLKELVSGRVPLAAQQGGSSSSTDEVRHRLAGGTSSSTQPSAPSPAVQPASVEDMGAVWESLGAPSSDGLASAQPVHPQVSNDPAPSPQQAPPMPMDEMQRLVEQRQARMMQRLESQGVQYKGPGGPSEGKRLTPHESVSAPQPSVSSETSATPDGEYRSPYGAHRNEEQRRNANGMTREEMVAAIAKATGKAPEPPPASPVQKPPGF